MKARESPCSRAGRRSGGRSCGCRVGTRATTRRCSPSIAIPPGSSESDESVSGPRQQDRGPQTPLGRRALWHSFRSRRAGARVVGSRDARADHRLRRRISAARACMGAISSRSTTTAGSCWANRVWAALSMNPHAEDARVYSARHQICGRRTVMRLTSQHDDWLEVCRSEPV